MDKNAGVEKEVDFPFLLPHEFIQHLVERAGEGIHMFQVTDTSGQHMAAAVEEWCAHFGVKKKFWCCPLAFMAMGCLSRQRCETVWNNSVGLFVASHRPQELCTPPSRSQL
jgi:hypothetical protein